MPAVAAAKVFDLYCVWGIADKIVPVDVYILAARNACRHAVRLAMALQPAAGRKFTPVGQVTRMNNRQGILAQRHGAASRCVKVDLEARATALAGLPFTVAGCDDF